MSPSASWTPATASWSPIPATPYTPSAPGSPAGSAGGCPSWRRTAGSPIWTPSTAGDADAAKVMWLNYPNNPTGAIADLSYFERVVDFAREHDIAVMHDASYSEVAYDRYKPVSFLQAGGGADVGLEFHSLSKSYNMTGWRVGAAVGNAEMIRALMVVKSNLDSGIPNAIQYMAIEALDSPLGSIDDRNGIYRRRRDKIVASLQRMGLHVDIPKASLYVWARIPDRYTSAEFAEQLLDECDIVVTPGSGYGAYGEGYVRFSLTIADEQLERGLARLDGWRGPS